MAYFIFHENCHHYADEWERLLRYIRTEWKPDFSSRLDDMAHHIEAKALYVFTLSRHLIERSEGMAKDGNWHPVFIESTILLFPMLEIVGEARLGGLGGSPLNSGLEWLRDPLKFPTAGVTEERLKGDDTKLASIGAHMATLPKGPRMRELFHIRNYFIHGLKNQHDPDFDIGAVRTSMNYELPKGVAIRSRECLAAYWKQLTDSAATLSRPWIERLADADIYPFGIMGSTTYEHGLVDPTIVEWIATL